MVHSARQPHGAGSDARHGRLNLLLSYAGWREQSWVDQLPCLLQPFGITSIRVNSGSEAADVIRAQMMHIAIVDLGLPLETQCRSKAMMPGAETGGMRILKLLRRLESPPPTVVIRQARDRTLANQRTLNEALRDGAFAVLDIPVRLEQMLEVMQRIVARYYSDAWPPCDTK